MSNRKAVQQNVIPKKVVEMAKAIIDADKKRQNLTIVQKRQSGKTAAYKLARNNN